RIPDWRPQSEIPTKPDAISHRRGRPARTQHATASDAPPHAESCRCAAVPSTRKSCGHSPLKPLLRNSGMKFELYKDVALSRDLPEERLKRGELKKLVEHHLGRDQEDGYSAEVFNAVGDTRR